MGSTQPLNPHPRLYIGTREIERLRQPADSPLLRRAGAAVKALADQAAPSPVFEWNRNTHNAHQIRARIMLVRVVALLTQWLRTGERRYRDAVIEHVAEMGRWEYWSWIAWRDDKADPNAIFDLSYGENSTTLAIAYDLLHDTLGRDERRLFVDIARRRSLGPCLRLSRGDKGLWWWTAYGSNWLTVCGGGAGMLCLAMYEDAPEARKLLPRLDRQLLGYMRHAQKCDGGWPEGVGYWGYGMRFGFVYWLSHERATGRAHPAMRMPAARRTLWFPADFSPHNVGTGFGDVAVPWMPEPFHYAAAERFGEAALIDEMDALLAADLSATGTGWVGAAEYLLLRPRAKSGMGVSPMSSDTGKMPVLRQRAVARPKVRLYRGMEWGYLADRMPRPNVYLSFRSGTTTDGHSHVDLLSFQCLMGGEPMLATQSQREYLDTTFSDRRHEVFEIGWYGKNTILIGGVGVSRPSRVRATPLVLPGAQGFRVDARGAIRITYQEQQQVLDVTRAFLMLGDKAFLILDRVKLRGTNAIESRFCSPARVTIAGSTARLAGRRQTACLAFAATAPCSLVTSQTIPTRPQTPPATLVRWCTLGLEQDVLLATVISSGAKPARVAVGRQGRAFEVRVSGNGFKTCLRLSESLRAVRQSPKGEKA
ncbi:MAG: heparinase II/III family protein [Phycisphaerae bacterium]|nr:heparinase II/III family protein [Phycisphaerae bacterium]